MIRKATINDAQQLTEIAYLVLAELYNPIATTDEEKSKQKTDLTKLIKMDNLPMSYKNINVFVEDNEILGAIWSYDYRYFTGMLEHLYALEKNDHMLIPHLVEEARSEDYYIDTIAVLSKARGKKIAQQLLQNILNHDYRKDIALIVDKQKEIPVYLYQKLGFNIVEANEMYGSIYYYMKYNKATIKE